MRLSTAALAALLFLAAPAAAQTDYAAQIKEASNGNHFLVLTEGKRDKDTGELRKTRLFIFSEDFAALFRMLKETAEYIRAHPVSPQVKHRQAAFWAKRNARPAER